MVRISANISKKVPIPGTEFSSQQYGAAMEIEVSDADRPTFHPRAVYVPRVPDACCAIPVAVIIPSFRPARCRSRPRCQGIPG